MQALENIRAVAVSAEQSACVSLNAARDAYTFLEAERNGTEEALLQEAARQYREDKGCSVAESFMQVGQRAQYLKELATGDTTFHRAKVALQASARQTRYGQLAAD